VAGWEGGTGQLPAPALPAKILTCQKILFLMEKFFYPKIQNLGLEIPHLALSGSGNLGARMKFGAPTRNFLWWKFGGKLQVFAHHNFLAGDATETKYYTLKVLRWFICHDCIKAFHSCQIFGVNTLNSGFRSMCENGPCHSLVKFIMMQILAVKNTCNDLCRIYT